MEFLPSLQKPIHLSPRGLLGPGVLTFPVQGLFQTGLRTNSRTSNLPVGVSQPFLPTATVNCAKTCLS
ncbi:unknown protein [Microcystis aeruginosa NIES-843]|uniref:Uncharacterized protein n=1 Tax=Microcystis aeruginosa (strain NIES-843 / IAM M-2473) TaxID=449447 RepID=B0JR06_MICAN|nr:unknown protein [Microcystis aeruginosa NIES-843]